MSLLATCFVLISCWGQNNSDTYEKLVGGPCEGCEAIHEYGDKVLSNTDTLPLFLDHEPKLHLSGTVYHADGKTPAEDVILYIYHTNRQGIYQRNGDEKGWARRHGFIRGWIKTGADGKYSFYTFRPAAYPNGREPEHIHVTVKEPGKKEYYIDDFQFDDDPLLTSVNRGRKKNRGGSGIVQPSSKNGILTIQRDLILGLIFLIMIRSFAPTIVFLLSVLCSCQSPPLVQKVIISQQKDETIIKGKIDTVDIDLSRSTVNWKGTKMRQTGKHEGTAELHSAYLLFQDAQLIGGHCKIDMSTIKVTDMPSHEVIARNNLENHLKGEDFFDVEKYPYSKFHISEVKQTASNEKLMSGNLTIKGPYRAYFILLQYSGPHVIKYFSTGSVQMEYWL